MTVGIRLRHGAQRATFDEICARSRLMLRSIAARLIEAIARPLGHRPSERIASGAPYLLTMRCVGCMHGVGLSL